jgi:hypothetical protein
MILPPKRPRPAKPTPLEKLLAEPVYKEIPIVDPENWTTS